MSLKAILFTSKGCVPCTAMKNLLPGACEKAGVELQVADVMEETDLAIQHFVRAAPTTLLLRDGEVIARLNGAHPLSRVEAFLKV